MKPVAKHNSFQLFYLKLTSISDFSGRNISSFLILNENLDQSRFKVSSFVKEEIWNLDESAQKILNLRNAIKSADWSGIRYN